MAWKETCVREQREEFIEDWLKRQWNVRELCRRYGIAAKTGYKWLNRFVGQGKAGLMDQRRARSEQAHRTPLEVEERVIELRLAKPYWGPKKLKRLLEDRDPATSWPAESTIGEILKRHKPGEDAEAPGAWAPVVGPTGTRSGSEPGVVHGLQGLVPVRGW